MDKLATYRQMRDPGRTPEPVPATGPLPEGNDDTFVIQEHHARRLHWDVRLERDGVLVSWAVPKGLPLDPKTNHLAVHTEDHPLEYATFEGDIPRGEYGGGKVIIWDRGRYVVEKWTAREVKVVFHGSRASGRYVFFHTHGKDWMVHRMDPPPQPGWQPAPLELRPMRPVAGTLPPAAEDDQWGYEMDWGGERAIVVVEGGRARVQVNGEDDTAIFPELRDLGPTLGSRACVLDGLVVVLGSDGRPSPSALRERRTAPPARLRRMVTAAPISYLVSDLLHLDGQDTTSVRYAERRELLDDFLPPHARWHLSPMIVGGQAALAASRDLGLRGIVAKRLDSGYQPGRRNGAWRSISNRPTQHVLVCGWLSATGANGQPDRRGAARSDRSAPEPVALLLGVQTGAGLAYAGTVRTGLTGTARTELAGKLRRLARKTPPFTAGSRPAVEAAQWVRPIVAGEVSYDEWTRDGTLRRPAWLGVRAAGEAGSAVRRAGEPSWSGSAGSPRGRGGS